MQINEIRISEIPSWVEDQLGSYLPSQKRPLWKLIDSGIYIEVELQELSENIAYFLKSITVNSLYWPLLEALARYFKVDILKIFKSLKLR